MHRTDWKKTQQELYDAPERDVAYIHVPKIDLFMLDGRGAPGGEVFRQAIAAVATVARAAADDVARGHPTEAFEPMPVEALYSMPSPNHRPDDWRWTVMMRHPVQATQQVLEAAKRTVAGRGPPSVSEVRLETLREGLSAQTLHLGPYEAVGATVERLARAVTDGGYVYAGRHHEIYLDDPGRTPPERLRTLIRQPVKPATQTLADEAHAGSLEHKPHHPPPRRSKLDARRERRMPVPTHRPGRRSDSGH